MSHISQDQIAKLQQEARTCREVASQISSRTAAAALLEAAQSFDHQAAMLRQLHKQQKTAASTLTQNSSSKLSSLLRLVRLFDAPNILNPQTRSAPAPPREAPSAEYDDYLAVVVADIAYRTRRTLRQAQKLVGNELDEMLKAGLTPSEAADELIAAATED